MEKDKKSFGPKLIQQINKESLKQNSKEVKSIHNPTEHIQRNFIEELMNNSEFKKHSSSCIATYGSAEVIDEGDEVPEIEEEKNPNHNNAISIMEKFQIQNNKEEDKNNSNIKYSIEEEFKMRKEKALQKIKECEVLLLKQEYVQALKTSLEV